MRSIILSRGKAIALVDDEDFDRVADFGRWHLLTIPFRHKQYQYAVRTVNRRNVMMHRFILDASPGLVVDHIDGDGLNNVRSNLRQCTTRQNIANQARRKNGSSQFKGLRRADNGKGWVVNCQGRYVGTFADEAQAARAYDAVARIAFGEFARLNFPREGEQSAVA